MSKVADTFNGLGYLPLQHKGCIDTGWSVATMDSVICIRTNGRERTGDNAGAYGEVPECRGNLGGAVCWQVPPSSPRKIAMWNFAFPAVVTPTTAMASYSAAGTTSSGPSAGGHSPADGSYNVLPIRDESNTGDSRFYSFTLPRPDGYPKLPVGTLGVVVGGTEENREVPRFMSCDGRLVAVNFSGDAACGSVVCDLDKSNRVDNTRTARLQSAFRVIKNPVINGGLFGIIAKALPNCIAIQLGATGLDDTFGGLVYDKGAGDVMGALSHVNFGPISVGGAADQHQLGQDADGHPINSGHISLNAYFRNGDGSFDGPLMHSGEWKGANDAPYSTYVFMEYDASIPHPFALGTRFGRHRWRAKCFQYVPDTPTPAPHDPTTPGHPGDPKKPHDEPTPDGGGGGGPTDDPSHGGIPVVGTGDGGIPVGGVPIDPDDSIPNGGGSDVPPGWGPPPPGWGKDPVSPPAPKGSDPAPGDSPKGKAKGKAEGAGEKLKVGPLKGGDKGFGGWKGAPWGPFGLGKKGLGFGGWKDAPWGPFGLGKKGFGGWGPGVDPPSDGGSLRGRAVTVSPHNPFRGRGQVVEPPIDPNRKPGTGHVPGDLGLPGGIPASAMRPASRIAPVVYTTSPTQYRETVASPIETLQGSLSFRPQLYQPGVPAIGNWMSPTAAARRAYDLETPVVARLEPYGATGGTAGVGTFDGSAGAGTPWTRNFEPGQRFPGGTMAGGLMFLPPELSGSDRLSGFAPSGVTLSTPHFTFGPSTYLALGLPDYKTGGIVSGHRARETAAALTVQRVSASGVATDQVNLPAAGGLQASLDGTVMAGVLLNLANDTVAASTAADTLETGLSVLTLPGGSVTSPGQAVILRAWGTCAANENPKTIRVYSYAGAWTVLATNDVVTNPNGGSWSSSAKIVFQNPVTSQTATGQMATGAAPNSTMTTSPTNLNPANDISFYVTGQNGVASAGDIAFAGFELEVAS